MKELKKLLVPVLIVSLCVNLLLGFLAVKQRADTANSLCAQAVNDAANASWFIDKAVQKNDRRYLRTAGRVLADLSGLLEGEFGCKMGIEVYKSQKASAPTLGQINFLASLILTGNSDVKVEHLGYSAGDEPFTEQQAALLQMMSAELKTFYLSFYEEGVTAENYTRAKRKNSSVSAINKALQTLGENVSAYF